MADQVERWFATNGFVSKSVVRHCREGAECDSPGPTDTNQKQLGNYETASKKELGKDYPKTGASPDGSRPIPSNRAIANL